MNGHLLSGREFAELSLAPQEQPAVPNSTEDPTKAFTSPSASSKADAASEAGEKNHVKASMFLPRNEAFIIITIFSVDTGTDSSSIAGIVNPGLQSEHRMALACSAFLGNLILTARS